MKSNNSLTQQEEKIEKHLWPKDVTKRVIQLFIEKGNFQSTLKDDKKNSSFILTIKYK